MARIINVKRIAVLCLLTLLIAVSSAIAQQATPVYREYAPAASPSAPPATVSDARVLPKVVAPDGVESIEITYATKRKLAPESVSADTYQPLVFNGAESIRLRLDTDLDEIDLPPNGKRAAVRALTAARHDQLLKNLQEAKTDEEKKAAAAALKDNYTRHYAIETWWREQKLAELEARLVEMQAQVQQRQDAEAKYVEATMTIAQLWVDGIGIAPPKPRDKENGYGIPYATLPATQPPVLQRNAGPAPTLSVPGRRN